jgi:hypothetical protein
MKTARALMLVFLFLVLVGADQSWGEIIPGDRRIDWEPGIPGGIPSRTAICANVKDAPYKAEGDGVTDDTAAIQRAINDCPEGQGVYLPTGTYKLTYPLSIHKGIVLRGDGPDKTRILGNSSRARTIINIGGWVEKNATHVVSGYRKGSKSIIVSDASDFKSGDYIIIDQLNDRSFVDRKDCTWYNRENNNRALGQILQVISVEVATKKITFDPELYYTFSSTYCPQVFKVAEKVVKYAGIEDLYVERVNAYPGQGFNIRVQGAAYCWVKNVESNKVSGRHIQFSRCFRCELRDSFIHHAHNYGAGGKAYGISLTEMSSDTLVENNIAYYLNTGIELEGAGPGNVIAYNYTDVMWNHDYPNTTWLMADIGSHCAHPYMALFEGNILSHFSPDYQHGSASHYTLFRNYIDRQHFAKHTAFPNDYDGNTRRHRVPIDIWYFNRYMNVVGNVLGQPGDTGSYEIEGRDCADDEVAIYKLGYNSDGDCSGAGNDPQVKATLLRHGNYDYMNNATLWDPNIPERTLPFSLYLRSKPAFFGNLRWPAIGPDLDPMIGTLPAKQRFETMAPR